MQTFVSIIFAVLLTWAIFEEEIEEETIQPEKKKKYIRVKRNGKWADEEIND